MRGRKIDLLFAIALVLAGHYYLDGRAAPFAVVEKGACVALMALWAAVQARGVDGWLIAAALAFGALGDVLIETSGLTSGALAFLVGHVISTVLYLRNRGRHSWLAMPVALLIALIAWRLPTDREAALGVAIYAIALGAMAGSALVSRFPRFIVGSGVLLFVSSDLLIFARLGPLYGSVVPGALIWPLYFAGQAMIAWGVVSKLRGTIIR